MELIEPNWPAPPAVRACTTTRDGGVSDGPYASLNLGDHVGDAPARVVANRRRLREHLGLPSEPRWLRQVHGCDLVSTEVAPPWTPGESGGPAADGAVARVAGQVCAVMSADCLPVLLCDADATCVAAVHAGWRGLASGILERAVAATRISVDRLLVWLGPAIGPDAFEVGAEVRERFVAADAGCADAFRNSPSGRFLADLAGLARRRLVRLGVTDVYGGGYCTVSDPRRFFSYRRDGVTGRMASLIWLDPATAPAADADIGDPRHA